MDWNAMNFDWNRARAFLITATEGSFSKAAKALGMTQSTLGRQVSALEQELGVVLFERIGKGIEITPAGLELLEFVQAMGDAATEFSIAASGRDAHLEGSVVVTASEVMAVCILPHLLKKLRQQEPGISFVIMSSNTAADLRRREADIAIRNFQPTHADLIAHKLKDTRAYLYCLPSYLEFIGGFQQLSDIRKCELFGMVENTRYLAGLRELGLDVSEKNFPYLCSSHLSHIQLIKEGLGVGVMPHFIEAIEPTFVRLSDLIPPFSIETWLVSHRELRTNKRIRLVFDFLEQELNQILR